MKSAIILHGKMSPEGSRRLPSSNEHWIPWLRERLITQGVQAYTPLMPEAWQPKYPTWQQEFERFAISSETTLVGHSVGGGFIVRWLSEHPEVTVDSVALVAPTLGENWPDRSFFNFEIDPLLTSRVGKLIIYHSRDDSDNIHNAVAELRSTLTGVRYREFENYGHFSQPAFPELLEELLQK